VGADYSAKRIVSLQPSATVILAAVGRADRIVACTRYCADVCPEVKEPGRTIVADSWTAQADDISAAKPDLVIAAVPYQEKAVTEILRSGARFLGLAPKTLADIYTDIATIAGVVSAVDQGQQVIEQMQSEIGLLRSQTEGLGRVRVFCEEWGNPIIASQPWVAELVQAAGGEFVRTPGAQCSAEEVLAEDPDVFIASWCGAGDRVPLTKIMSARGWNDTHAVKKRRVYCISDELLNTPAPTLLQGLQALAAALHPERFPQTSGLRWIDDVKEIQPTSAPEVDSAHVEH
jgi:iron complex transport system substrate-binding protein